MPRKFKHRQSKDDRRRAEIEEAEATEALRQELYHKLNTYADRLGLEELKRRCRERGLPVDELS